MLNKLLTIIKSKLDLPYALVTSQYALMLEYRAEIILWAISGFLPLIMLGIWREAGISLSMGLNDQWLTRYFVSAFFVRQFTAVWVMISFEEDISKVVCLLTCSNQFSHSGDITHHILLNKLVGYQLFLLLCL